VDVVIAGDVHAPVHTNCAGVHVVVPGATEHFTFNENWTPGFAWIEFDGSQVQVRHEALTPQPRCNLTLAAADVGDDPTGAALALVRAHANSDTIARLAVTGVLRREQYRRLNAAVIEDAGRRSYFAFELDLRDLRVQFDTGENRSWAPRRTMAEEVRAVIEEDLARTRDPAERALLERTRDELLAALLAEGEEAAR
jgi:DNA repair exonuclease SbcCD nuclease subunit